LLKTLAALYSVRAKLGAPVSTPLKWSEVKKRLDLRDYTIKTIIRRLKKMGDLFSPVFGKRNRFTSGSKKYFERSSLT